MMNLLTYFGIEISRRGLVEFVPMTRFLPEVREFIKDTRPKTNTTRGGRKGAWTDGPPPATFTVAQRTLCAVRP